MIHFFRKTRKKLADDNKFLKYWRYAIGEIVLVVVGILIALSINNWNEERKKQNLKGIYNRALIEDLEKDINQLSKDIDKTIKDLENCKTISRIITENEFDVDSIIMIYRKEFNVLIHVDRNFNRNTIEALLSTGNINLFKDTIYDELMRFNNLQKEVVSAIDTELGFYMNYLTQNNLPQADKFSLIQGANLDEIWNLIDKDKFLISFNLVLNSQSIVNEIMLEKRRELMKETKLLLGILSDTDYF